MSRDGPCELITIPISHYCEKARWALDRAGIPYRERAHLQAIHWFAVRRAGGARTVPVLGSVLIASTAGHVLIDGALPESVPQIVAHIKELGFRVEDIKLIVNSHVHFDHAGGISELQKLSGARVAASPWSAAVLKSGMMARDDPQFGSPVGGKGIAKHEALPREGLHSDSRASPQASTLRHRSEKTRGGASRFY